MVMVIHSILCEECSSLRIIHICQSVTLSYQHWTTIPSWMVESTVELTVTKMTGNEIQIDRVSLQSWRKGYNVERWSNHEYSISNPKYWPFWSIGIHWIRRYVKAGKLEIKLQSLASYTVKMNGLFQPNLGCLSCTLNLNWSHFVNMLLPWWL